MNMNCHPELDDSLLLDVEYHMRTGGVNWAIALGRHDIQHSAVLLLFSRRRTAVIIVGGVIPHISLHFPPNSAPNFHPHTPTVTCKAGISSHLCYPVLYQETRHPFMLAALLQHRLSCFRLLVLSPSFHPWTTIRQGESLYVVFVVTEKVAVQEVNEGPRMI
jgi:hypothetical protein